MTFIELLKIIATAVIFTSITGFLGWVFYNVIKNFTDFFDNDNDGFHK